MIFKSLNVIARPKLIQKFNWVFKDNFSKAIIPKVDIREELNAALVEQEPNHRNFINTAKERDQSKYSFRPTIDPQKTSVILFPGQGSQYIGMAKNLKGVKNVPEMFELASQILGYNLLNICENGPKSELDSTLYCQPAIFVTSLAVIEKLHQTNPEAIENCIATAGFSLGEYSALVFSGAISFEQGIKLLKIRSTEMQKVSENVKSGMMTVFSNPSTKLNEACKVAIQHCLERGIKYPVCSIANYLYPECKVIAGNLEALKFIETNYKDYNILRTKYLPVNGAYHSKLMQPAYQPLADALDLIDDIQEPLISVFSNVTSHRYKNSQQIKKLLCQQLIKPVKWEQTIHVIYERPQNTNFPMTYECGPGNNLGLILKMNNRKAHDHYTHII